MKKRILAMILALVMVIVLSACGAPAANDAPNAPAEATPNAGGAGNDIQVDEAPVVEAVTAGTVEGSVLHAYIPSEMTNDQVTPWAGGMWSRNYAIPTSMFDGLIAYNNGDRGDLVEGLATSWDISDDGLTYTFHLRDGVQFHNGDPFTAKDVIATFDYMMQYEAAQSGYSQVESWTAPDDSTVVFTLSAPWSSFLYYLSGQNCPILNARLIEQYGESNEACVGTGAYMLDKVDSGASVTLKANPNYWKTPAEIETIIVYYIGNKDTAFMALKTGELDFMYNMDEIQADEAKTIDGLSTFSYLKENAECLWFNAADESLTPEIRQALYYLIDNEEAALAGFGEYGVPVDQAWIPEFGGYVDPAELTYPKETNAEKGLQILADAGIEPSDLTITILYPTVATQRVSLAENIQAQLAQYGINVVLDARDWMSCRGALMANEYQCLIWDTEPALSTPIVTYTWVFKDGGFNLANISNGNPALYEQIMDLIHQADTLNDVDARNELFREITKLMNDNMMFVPLTTNITTIAYNSDFNCYYNHDHGEFYYWSING